MAPSQPDPPVSDLADPRVAHNLDLGVGPTVVRIREDNPGMFTGPGTNTFLVGDETLWLIDPGEDRDDGHRAAILDAVAGRQVEGVLITHRHRDHWPLGVRLAQEWSTPLVGLPHQENTETVDGPASSELGLPNALVFDRELEDGDTVSGDGFALECLHTPGHCADHASFVLKGLASSDTNAEPVIFCGDHVMAWSTTILAPPDGSLNQYLTSLDRLLSLGPRLLLPAHGPTVHSPRARVIELREHRLRRSQQLLEALSQGPETLETLVPLIYADTDPALHGAAAASLSAHVEALTEDGRIIADSTNPALLHLA